MLLRGGRPCGQKMIGPGGRPGPRSRNASVRVRLVHRVAVRRLSHPRTELEHGLHELPVALLLRLLLREPSETGGLEPAALGLDALDHAAHLGEAAREVGLLGRFGLTVRLVHRASSGSRSGGAFPVPRFVRLASGAVVNPVDQVRAGTLVGAFHVPGRQRQRERRLRDREAFDQAQHEHEPRRLVEVVDPERDGSARAILELVPAVHATFTRSAASTLFLRRSIWNGFGKHARTPSLVSTRSVSSVPYAVTTMNAAGFGRARRRRTSVAPSIRGSLKSVITRSAGCFLNAASAFSALSTATIS